MNKKAFLVTLVLFALFILLGMTAGPVFGGQNHSDGSGVAVPTPQPTPSPTPVPETTKALEYIASREGIPVGDLFLSSEFRQEYPTIGKQYWVVKAVNRKDGQWYGVMIALGLYIRSRW